MKTGIFLAVLVVLLAALATPFGFGYWADARLDRVLEKLSDNGVIAIEVVAESRGWLHSTSDMVVQVRGDIARRYEEYQQNAGAESEPLRCTVRNRIHHGPFPFVDDSKPAIAIVDSEFVAGPRCQALQERLGLRVRTRFEFDGSGTTDLAIPEQTVSAAEGDGLVNWLGLDAEINFSRDFDRVRTAIISPGVDVSDVTAEVHVRDLRWRSDMHEGIEGIELGDFELSVASVAFAPKTDEAMKTSLGQMVLRGASMEGDNATVDTELSLSAQQLSAGGLRFGPASYALALRNLDAAAMAKIKSAMADARRKNLPEQQTNMLVGATLLGALPDILKKGPVLEVTEFRIASPEGTAHGAARLTVDTTDPATLQNPLLLSQALVLDANLQFPEALLVALAKRSIAQEVAQLDSTYSDEQIEAMARMRVRQGMGSEQAQRWFVLADGVYRLELHMDQGQLTLNGQPVQPGALAP